MVNIDLGPSQFLFGAGAEQRFVNQRVNAQVKQLLGEAYQDIDNSFGPKNISRFNGNKFFSYMAQEAILGSLAHETDKYFADPEQDDTALVPFLAILDKVQQQGAVFSQDILKSAREVTQKVEAHDQQYDLPDRLTQVTGDGKYVRYLFIDSKDGGIRLVKFVSQEPLTYSQRVDLAESLVVSEKFNASLGSPRLVEIDIHAIVSKKDLQKIGGFGVDFAKSDISLVTKGPAYPNAQETLDAFDMIPGPGKWFAARRRQHYEGETVQQLLPAA